MDTATFTIIVGGCWQKLYNADNKKFDAITKRKSDEGCQGSVPNSTRCTESLFSQISIATTLKKAREILQEKFEGSDKVKAVKLQTLRRQFKNLQIKESEKVKEYFSRVIEIVNQMRTYGVDSCWDISDHKIVEKILIRVTKKYDYILTAIEESKDLLTLSIQ